MSKSSEGSEFKTDITADPASFIKGMQSAADSAANASKLIDAELKKIGDTFTQVTKFATQFAAVLAGGGALKKFISDANDWNGTAAKMSSQLGLTTERASVLNVALVRLGIDSETYTGASQRLSKQVQSNAQAFDVMGIKVRDATGAYRPVTELMEEVNQKLMAIKNPIEQNIAGQQVYGKGWAEVRGILRLTSEQMQQAEVRARQLGLIVGPEGAALSKQYTSQMRDLNLVGKSLEVQFGNQLLPVFTQVGAVMSENVTPFAKAMSTVLQTLVVVGMEVSFVFKTMAKDIVASAEAFMLMQKWDFSGARGVLNTRAADAALDRQKLDFATAQIINGPNAGAGRGFVNPTGGPVNQGPRYNFRKESDGAGGDKSRMAQWEADLAQRKAALERTSMLEGQFREMSKAEELKYWQDIAAKQRLTDGERISLTKKTSDVEMSMIREGFELKVKALHAEAEQYKHNTEERLRIERQAQSMYGAGTKEFEEAQKRINAIQRQAVEQAKAVANSRVEAEREARLQVVALQEQEVQTALQMGLISQRDLLLAQQQFEQQRSAIALEAINQRLMVAEHANDLDIVEIERLNREKERLEAEHQLKLQQIKGALRVDAFQPLTDVMKSAETSFASALQGILGRTQTFRQAMASLWQGISQSIIGEIAKVIAKKAAAWVIERGMAIAGIGAKAADAGAGAAASVSSIPVIGPALALAAMGMIFGSVSKLANSVPNFSAAGGFDIPSSINPIVQTHAREMVLPAKYADVIRQQADAGSASGRGGDVHLHVPPPRDLGDMFMGSRQGLLAALSRALKDNHRKLA